MASHISPTRRWSALATAAALLAAGTLTACGGNDNGSSSSTAASAPATTTPRTVTTPSRTVTTPGGATATTPGRTTTTPAGTASSRLALTADEAGGLSFSRRALTARAGDVTIDLDNPTGNSLPHAVEITGNGVERASTTIDPGATTAVTASLRPGTYTFYCPVDSHRQAGMVGTLTVR